MQCNISCEVLVSDFGRTKRFPGKIRIVDSYEAFPLWSVGTLFIVITTSRRSLEACEDVNERRIDDYRASKSLPGNARESPSNMTTLRSSRDSECSLGTSPQLQARFKTGC
jgi:hypothetical protein